MGHNQNRRSRGRGRKGPNPLSRSYESNGPDVKIRGTAAHVAEKYSSLARDALSAGDTVAAEAYFQHAEHYNRIVAAAQAQAQPPSQPPMGRFPGEDGESRRDYNGGDRGDDGEGATANGDGATAGAEQKSAPAEAGNGADDQSRQDSDSQPSEARKPVNRRPRRKKADIVAAAGEAPASEDAAADKDKKAAAGEDKTQDGAAALAAFPD